jgi:glycosyltransferase involved in cell wall biosynthesis
MKLSVIIPAYNEEKRITDTLQNVDGYLKTQNYDYEIIVVVNGSHDNTFDVVKNYYDVNTQFHQWVNTFSEVLTCPSQKIQP